MLIMSEWISCRFLHWWGGGSVRNGIELFNQEAAAPFSTSVHACRLVVGQTFLARFRRVGVGEFYDGVRTVAATHRPASRTGVATAVFREVSPAECQTPSDQ